LPTKGPEELLLAAYEIERNKHLVKKIGMAGLHVWAVSIVFYGKSKFLGYFNSYEVGKFMILHFNHRISHDCDFLPTRGQ